MYIPAKRSDAAVVGSGNVFAYVLKLDQLEACRTWGSIIIRIKSS